MLNSFCSSILLFELLGILVLSRWRNIRIQAPHIQNPVCFCRFNIVQTSRSRASIYVQSLLKFPTWGAQGRSKSPPRPVVPPPPSDITLIAALVCMIIDSATSVYQPLPFKKNLHLPLKMPLDARAYTISDKHVHIIFNNYSPKWRWLAVDIYRAAKRRGKYPTLATDTEVNSCFSIY